MASPPTPIPGLYRRGNVFWLRIVQPKDLQHLNDGKRLAFHGTLATTDEGVARVQAMALRLNFESKWQKARADLVEPRKIKPTQALIDLLAERVHYTILKEDDERRAAGDILAGVPLLPDDFGPLSHDPFERHDQITDAQQVWAGALAHQLSLGEVDIGRQFANYEVKALGLPEIDWTGQKLGLIKIMRAVVQAFSDAAERSAGALINTPREPVAPAVIAQAVPVQARPSAELPASGLRTVLPRWQTRTKAKPNAISRTERALTLWEESGLAVPLKQMTKATGARFQEWLLDEPARGFGSKTAANHWSALQALLNVAVKIDELPANPWAGLNFEGGEDGVKRRPFTRTELRKIAAALAATTEGGDWATYWCVLAGMHMGMRIGEIAQAALIDVHNVDGVACIEIHERTEGTTVKTDAGERMVPIHPELLRLGFMDHVQSMREAGGTKLFPSLHRRPKGKPADIMSKRFKALRDSVGCEDPRTPFHSLRHNVRSALVEASINERIIDAIIGHSDGAVQARYTHISASALRDAIEKVQWGLGLTRTFPATPVGPSDARAGMLAPSP